MSSKGEKNDNLTGAIRNINQILSTNAKIWNGIKYNSYLLQLKV